MEEREKEIQVHKDILVSELKAAEEERHLVAVELQKRKSKVKNLRIKFEGLQQKQSGNNGEEVGERSQAYYVIKAAQEREEILKRKKEEVEKKAEQDRKEKEKVEEELAQQISQTMQFKKKTYEAKARAQTAEEKIEQERLAKEEALRELSLVGATNEYDSIVSEQNDLKNKWMS